MPPRSAEPVGVFVQTGATPRVQTRGPDISALGSFHRARGRGSLDEPPEPPGERPFEAPGLSLVVSTAAGLRPAA